MRKIAGNAPKRRIRRITPAPVSGLSKRDVRLIEKADVLRETLYDISISMDTGAYKSESQQTPYSGKPRLRGELMQSVQQEEIEE